ncbi:MAG: metal ABC transporter permease [Quadrisphaera sp.]
MSWDAVINFDDYSRLLPLVTNSLWAAAALGLVGGLVGVLVAARDMAFAVHGISELSFAGAAAALLLSVDVVLGSVVGSLLAAVLIGVLGVRARDRNSIIGVLMPFGLGLGVLFLALYPGRSANKFGLAHRAGGGRRRPAPGDDAGHLRGRARRAGRGVAPAAVRQRRPRRRRRARGAGARVVAGVHGGARAVRGHGGAGGGGRCSCCRCSSPRPRPPPGSPPRRCGCPCCRWPSRSPPPWAASCWRWAGTVPISPFVTTISFAIYVVCRVLGARRGRRGWTRRRPVPPARPGQPSGLAGSPV